MVTQKQDSHHVESATADGSSDQTDPVEAKRILRKVDWRIIPLLQFLYMLTFLDRVNIGNARIWNLEKDLGMSGYEYNIVVLGEFTTLYALIYIDRNTYTKQHVVFYIPYIILELPANYVFNRVEPRKFIGVIMFGWGCKNNLSHPVPQSKSSLWFQLSLFSRVRPSHGAFCALFPMQETDRCSL